MESDIGYQFDNNYICLVTQRIYRPKQPLALSFRKGRKNLKEYRSMMKSVPNSIIMRSPN